MKFFNAKDHQPKGQQLFSQYYNKIKQISPIALVEHIGASTIPNCLSKGDLDIYVGCFKLVYWDAIDSLKVY